MGAPIPFYACLFSGLCMKNWDNFLSVFWRLSLGDLYARVCYIPDTQTVGVIWVDLSELRATE